MANQLDRYLRNTSILGNNAGYEYEKILSLTKDDLIIVMHSERYSKLVTDLTEFASERTECHILAITDSTIAPPVQYADIAFNVINDNDDLGIDSKVGLASFIELLVTEIIRLDQLRAMSHLHQMEAYIAPRIFLGTSAVTTQIETDARHTTPP